MIAANETVARHITYMEYPFIYRVHDSISKEKATTIIISHNLLNVKDADKIIVLEDGKISEIGTHDELINKEGFYSNVWKLQQMIEEVC